MKPLPTFPMAFAKILRIHRDHSKLTQPQLAEKIEGSELTIRTLERGKQIPTMTTFLLIADALNLSPKDMLDEILKEMARIELSPDEKNKL